MPTTRSYARSFVGGEVTPEFFGRFDDLKNQTGLQTCRNAIVKPHGPVANRGGLRFIARARNSATTPAVRVLPFVFSSDQSVVIEAGPGYFRFFTQGAVIESSPAAPYEVANPYLADDLQRLKFVQSNDVLTLTHPNYPPAELKRFADDNWTYGAIPFASTLAAPTGISATATPGGTPGTPSLQSYVVTAVRGADESAASQSGGGGGSPAPAQPVGGSIINSISQANPGTFHIDPVNDANAPSVGASVYVSGVGGMTQVNNQFYTVASVTPTVDGEGFPNGYDVTLGVDTTAFSAYIGGGTMGVSAGGAVSTTGVGTCSNNLFDGGAYNTIAWAPVTGAERYYVYKLENGLFGYLGQTLSTSFVDDNIAPDLSKTPPILSNPFASEHNYPGAVGYFEQRRFFGGTDNEPAYFWGTRSGTESNLAYSIPTRDDDSIRVRIAARERNEIRHIVPLIDLVLLTEAMEWRVQSTTGGALTPDVAIRPQSAIGCGHAPPVIVNNNILFAANRGGHLRELGFNNDAGGYITGDLCLRATHLFDAYSIVDIAYTKAPLPIVWCVSSSGQLLGITYVPEQQVGPWHRHDTEGGVFEHICAVPENGADVLYCVVARQTAFGTERFIERMDARLTTDDLNGFFVDSGLTYEGDPESTFGGLGHLEGKQVVALADGEVIDGLTVNGGQVMLDAPASLVHVGLRVTTDIETLPVAFEAAGYGQGRPKNVNKVWLRLFSTRDVKAGPSFARLREFRSRKTENYNSPPALVTGEIEIPLDNKWSSDGAICIRHDAPLPFTLLSITPEHAVGG